MRVERRHGFGPGLDEPVHVTLVQQHVVRRDARLAGIGQLAVGDVGCDPLERLPAIDQHGGLAAELECHRHEVLAGGAHHRAADRGAPREEQVIERQGREGGAHGGVAGDDSDFVLREGLGRPTPPGRHSSPA